jgi:hypothetical protein
VVVLASRAAHSLDILAIDRNDSLAAFGSRELLGVVVVERRRDALRSGRDFATHLVFELVDPCFSASKAADRIRAIAVARTINTHADPPAVSMKMQV